MTPDTISYVTEGSPNSAPVLLLAPLGRDHLSWSAQIGPWSGRFWCVLPDHRGTGRTPPSTDGYALGLLAQDALRVLDALGLDRVHVAGWSMGSAVAMELALAAPERVRSLSLYTPWARTDTTLRADFAAMERAAAAGADLVDVEELTLRMILSSEAVSAIPDLREAARAATDEAGYPTRDALIGHIRASIDHDVHDRLGRIAAPTLVVVGAEDRLTQAYHGREVASLIPGAELVEITGPGSSHALLLERADEFNQIAGDFLERH